MEDRFRTCRTSLDTITDCSKVDALDANNFIRGFQIVSNPEVFENDTLADIAARGDISDHLISITVHLCEDDAGGVTTCVARPDGFVPRSTFDCRNVAVSIAFELVHDGREGVASVDAFVRLADFGIKDVVIEQEFKYTYFQPRMKE